MTTDNRKPSPREIEIVHSSYQPSKVELKEDMRIDAAFEEAIQVLVRSGQDPIRQTPEAVVGSRFRTVSALSYIIPP